MSNKPQSTPATPAAADVGPKNNALAALARLDDGMFAFNFSTQLDALIAAVQEQGKKGSITVKIDVVPQPNFAPNAVKIIHDVVPKLPRRTPPFSMNFIKDGRLVGEDPRQQPLNFSEKKTVAISPPPVQEPAGTPATPAAGAQA